MEKINDFEASMTRSNILIEWRELSESKITFADMYDKEMAEAKLNQCCKVLAVGDDVKVIKPGQYALLGGAGRLLTINGTVYGVVKEHMIDMVFNEPPVLGRDAGKSEGGLILDKTDKKAQKFQDKHKFQQ
jgi:hypothetical protein